MNQKNKKDYFQNFSWFQFYISLQVMHDYVVFHRSIDYCVELIFIDENSYENCSNFTHWNDFGLIILLGKCAF